MTEIKLLKNIKLNINPPCCLLLIIMIFNPFFFSFQENSLLILNDFNEKNDLSPEIITKIDYNDCTNGYTPKFNHRLGNEVQSEKFGDQQFFWVPFDDFIQIRATLLAVGTHCYVYMANDSIDFLSEFVALAKCEELQNIFDSTIYPKGVELAGHLDGRRGDIDGDPHVTIFLAPLIENMGTVYLGFVQQHDDLPGPYSNLREMIYVDDDQNMNDTIRIIIHEFNHLIWFNYEVDEAVFLLEGLANYAVDYTGYHWHMNDYIASTFTTQYSDISLLYFHRFHHSYWAASYGQAYLFVKYLGERFGNDLLKDLVSITADAGLAIDVALKKYGYSITFNEVFLDWATACVLDDTLNNDGLYGFNSIDFKITSYHSLRFPSLEIQTEHYYYGFDVKRLSMEENGTFEIENPYPFALGTSIIVKENNSWNVKTAVHFENSTTITKSIPASNEIYIITSLMSNKTPIVYGSVNSLDEVPSEKLTFSVSKREITSKTTPFLPILLLVTTLLCLVKERNKITGIK